jgi:hypothetical protein
VGPFVKRNYGEDKLKKAIEDLNRLGNTQSDSELRSGNK